MVEHKGEGADGSFTMIIGENLGKTDLLRSNVVRVWC